MQSPESIVSMTAGILKIRLDLLMIKGKFPPARGAHRQATRTIIRPGSPASD